MGNSIDERWSTKKHDLLMLNHRLKGVIPDHHPFFNKKIGKRKAGLNYGYTKNEFIEFAKCENDIIYFAEEYCRILTPEGRKLIKDYKGLRPFQKEMLRMFQDEQYSIVLASRQIGKSITMAIFISWYILFHGDANVLLLSATGDKAKDLFKKIKEIQDSLPFFMQMGLVYDSTQRRIYENGSSITSENTTENSGVSGSYQLVYWDEMAILDPVLQDAIFTGTFPTMASFGDKAKFIITSTPRGRNNKFYHIWNGATAEKDSPDFNHFNPMKIYWHQVEGRGDEWKRKEISIMGEEGFAREYDLSFDADGSLLLNDINQRTLANGYTKYCVYKDTDEYKAKLNGVLKLHPDYNIENFLDKERKFKISIDIAGGKDRDYTVFNIFEIKFKTVDEILEMPVMADELDFFKMEQVGIIRNNQISVELMAIILYRFLTEYMVCENIKITIEMNYEGKFFLKNLFEYDGKKNKINEFREDMIVEYPVNMGFDKDKVRWEEGIIQNAGTKQESCKTLNPMISNHTISLSHSVTIDEGLSFGKNRKGKYEGFSRNDDCFMTVVNIANYNRTEDFEEQANYIYDNLSDDNLSVIEKHLGIDEDESDDIY